LIKGWEVWPSIGISINNITQTGVIFRWVILLIKKV